MFLEQNEFTAHDQNTGSISDADEAEGFPFDDKLVGGLNTSQTAGS
jgi:hypothetical protein